LYMHQKVNILGVQISSIYNDDLLAAFITNILQKKLVCIIPVNLVMAALESLQVKTIYNNTNYFLCGGPRCFTS